MTEATKAPTKAKFVPKVVKNLTLPIVKVNLEETVYLKFISPMKIGKEMQKDKDAAITAEVVNLETGETLQYLVPAVMQGVLHDEYGAPRFGAKSKGEPVEVLEGPITGQDADAYVGRGFAITKHAKATGKQYHPMTIMEVEV